MENLDLFLAAKAGSGTTEHYTENQVLRAFKWSDDRIRAIHWYFDDLRSRSDDVYIESESNEDLVKQVDRMYIKHFVETKLVNALIRIHEMGPDLESLISEMENYIDRIENYY